LKAVRINSAFFKNDETLFPLAKNNMKYQIHYEFESSKENVKVKNQEKTKNKREVKKKGN
jgi:hypothetical protein